eukprot:g59840.t1
MCWRHVPLTLRFVEMFYSRALSFYSPHPLTRTSSPSQPDSFCRSASVSQGLWLADNASGHGLCSVQSLAFPKIILGALHQANESVTPSN